MIGTVTFALPEAGAAKVRGRDAVHSELREQALVRVRIFELERDLAGQRPVRGVVDHDLDLGVVAFAQEAREVRPHHQLLDAPRLRAGPRPRGGRG